MGGWLGSSHGPSLAAVLPLTALPRLCHSRSPIASGGIFGLTFQTCVRADFSREQVAGVGCCMFLKLLP